MNWANFWSAISAISTAITALVAIVAIFRWRKQDELKAKMAFKVAIADYSFALLQLPEKLDRPEQYQNNEEGIRNLRDKYTACTQSWLVSENLMSKNKNVQENWFFIFSNHKNYLKGSIERKVLGACCVSILNEHFVFK